MNSNVTSTLQRNINIEWGGRGEPTDIAQKIAYRSTTFGQDCSSLKYYEKRNSYLVSSYDRRSLNAMPVLKLISTIRC